MEVMAVSEATTLLALVILAFAIWALAMIRGLRGLKD